MTDAKEELIAQLHQQYETALVKACWRHAHYEQRYMPLAEECVQEAFMLLFQRYDQLVSHPAMERWLLVTALHQMDNALYKQRVRDKHAAFSMDEFPNFSLAQHQSNIERWLEGDYAADCIARIRQTLTAKETTVFNDYFLEGLTAAEIADRQKTTVGGVKSVLRKIRRKARSEHMDVFLLALGILSHLR